jgi:DNA polymerase-3 subunit beta
MDLTVKTSDLKKVLSKLAPLTKGVTILPALQFTKIKTGDGVLRFSTSDLEVWADKQIPAEVVNTGSLYINTSVFNEFASTLKVDEVRLKSNGDHLIIEAENIHATINGIVPDEFPTKPAHESFSEPLTIDSTTLFNGIAQVADVASDDIARQVLTGVYLHNRDGKLYMVATDSYRLACQPLMNIDQEVKLLLPAKAMQFVSKLFEDEDSISIASSDDLVYFSAPETSLLCRVVDGVYPDYEQLIPKEFKTRIQVSKQDFESALRSATVFSKSAADSATLVFSESKQTLAVEGSGEDLTGKAKLLVEIKIEGEPISVKLNGKYAQNALNHIKNDVVNIGLNDKLSPILFTDDLDVDSYVHIVMPLNK